MSSLLGKFYSRIKGSQEDIASEGLVHILQNSEKCRASLTNLIKHDSGIEMNNLSFISQNIGEKLERPDISGINEEGNESLIIEAKFWASFTKNQPIEYLNRLDEHGILIILCPTLRVKNIFNEVLQRVHNSELTVSQQSDNKITLDNGKTILIKNWNEILSHLKITLNEYKNEKLLSDLNQIIGLCEVIDSNSFSPFQDSDLNPSKAKLICSFYDITDKVIDELKLRKLADTHKLNATPQKYGYTRYFRCGNFGMALHLNFKNWESEADTPYWLNVKDDTEGKHWVMTNKFGMVIKKFAAKEFIKCYEENSKQILLALHPKREEVENIVVKDLANQIEKIMLELKSSSI